jgi:type IV pilus assembly protein PilB
MTILDILLEQKKIDKKALIAIQEDTRMTGETTEHVLQKHGVSENDILLAKSEYYGISAMSLSGVEIPFDVLQFIPEESANHYKFIPIAVRQGVLEVGIVDPDDIEARDALNFISARAKMPFKAFLVSEADFVQSVQLYRGLSGEVTKALSELETDIADIDADAAPKKPEPGAGDSKATIIEDAPVTKIVATILRYAVEGSASDVHIERMVDRLRVRFRVDGDLFTSLVLPMKVHEAVVARIKILSNMKLDEKRKPQDGRFSARIEGKKIDFRVSTFPAYHGEKVVMRILDQDAGVKKIEDIGFDQRIIDAIRRAMGRPYGMILISGPTGSGKSTTVSAMMSELNDEKVNILTLEDPVEYNIEGVNQSQVRADIGYSFANGLRTALRQDPDIIMVGEIRDRETAQLAIQAALTGHLVISTIHTNTAIGVVARLVDMGVDPYLIAPTLIMTLAQRLVGKIAPGCEKAIPVQDSIKIMLEKEFEDLPAEYRAGIKIGENVYSAEPSNIYPTGIKGRVAVAEVVEFDHEFERAILANKSEEDLFKIARLKGFTTMKEDAMMKAFDKKIPWSAVNEL